MFNLLLYILAVLCGVIIGGGVGYCLALLKVKKVMELFDKTGGF